ncbi:MAG TPA: DnaD domain protein [Ktedonobacteraceae bacterium]|jgi:DNA replication protein|nr:DnaD domain protein [Ktedonobacteraceae bacterium]
MTQFAGFPSGKNPYVPVPEVFFTVLAPEIEDTAELKVTLHLFWLLAQKQGNPRCVSDRELMADKILLHSLKRKGDPRPAEERLHQGLEAAVARGTVLRIHLKLLSESTDQEEIIGWYFFNTARSRKVVAELQGGEIVPASLLDIEREPQVEQETALVQVGKSTPPRNYGAKQHIQVQIERPNIFVLYEQNIGLLSPLIADELQDAADHYPADWIEAAFREAVQHNKRKWSYIRAILRRWETEGRQAWNA